MSDWPVSRIADCGCGECRCGPTPPPIEGCCWDGRGGWNWCGFDECPVIVAAQEIAAASAPPSPLPIEEDAAA